MWIASVGSKTLQALEDTATTMQIMRTAGILKIKNTLAPRLLFRLLLSVWGRNLMLNGNVSSITKPMR